MRTTITIDDELYENAVKAADSTMDKADLIRSHESVRPGSGRQATGGAGWRGRRHERGSAATTHDRSPPVNRVLVDTSVWVAHFRIANPVLQSLLAADQVLCHPLIIVELACGTPPAPRARTLEALKRAPASRDCYAG